ncbi:hypothetical protein NDU88_002527 [Pleurodeles waltl]|uniref:Uncharacterized protein n=1 Tax=Pleurodeles waltl TaxID=8319 RepID=A0AAV7Q781_PLEWA|nr:hypothetical protein NDU88_002527 [Pleurodeles waltl]
MEPRVTGVTNVGLPPLPPGTSKRAATTTDVSCSLGRLPTGDAADFCCGGTGWARREAGDGGCGSVCSGDAAGGAGVSTCGGRHKESRTAAHWG